MNQDGFEGRLLLDLRSTPTWDSSLPVLTEINVAEDLSIPGPAKQMIASKGRKNRLVKAYFHGTQKDCVITASIVMDPADPAYIAIKNALSAETMLPLYICDRNPVAGDKVDRGEFKVFTPNRSHTANDESMLEVVFAPAYGATHPLHEFTWPS